MVVIKSANGPQFIAKDFKELIRVTGMTQVRTSPYYPQSNGKLERWHHPLKGDCIRTLTPLSLADARRLVAEFVQHDNQPRWHGAIGYVTPSDTLHNRNKAIHDARDQKLAEARERRRLIDYVTLRGFVTMAAVLQLLGFRVVSKHGEKQRGPCPLHGSTRGTN